MKASKRKELGSISWHFALILAWCVTELQPISGRVSKPLDVDCGLERRVILRLEAALSSYETFGEILRPYETIGETLRSYETFGKTKAFYRGSIYKKILVDSVFRYKTRKHCHIFNLQIIRSGPHPRFTHFCRLTQRTMLLRLCILLSLITSTRSNALASFAPVQESDQSIDKRSSISSIPNQSQLLSHSIQQAYGVFVA